MYQNDRNLGIIHSSVIPWVGEKIGIGGEKISKTQAIQGEHCNGPFSVEGVKYALDTASPTVRNQARSMVLSSGSGGGFSQELPGLTAQDTLIIARCLVWWAHGREDCKIGGDESKAIAFLTTLVARAGPPPPPPSAYPPPPAPAPAPALAGIGTNTLMLGGLALVAGLALSGGFGGRRR